MLMNPYIVLKHFFFPGMNNGYILQNKFKVSMPMHPEPFTGKCQMIPENLEGLRVHTH